MLTGHLAVVDWPVGRRSLTSWKTLTSQLARVGWPTGRLWRPDGERWLASWWPFSGQLLNDERLTGGR